MKNTNTCPKCGKNDIVRFDGFAGAYGSGNHVMTGSTVFSAVNVNRYICLDCGFTEEWIDTCDLDKIENSKKAKR
jgi:ribosomal protein S27AE